MIIVLRLRRRLRMIVGGRSLPLRTNAERVEVDSTSHLSYVSHSARLARSAVGLWCRRSADLQVALLAQAAPPAMLADEASTRTKLVALAARSVVLGAPLHEDALTHPPNLSDLSLLRMTNALRIQHE